VLALTATLFLAITPAPRIVRVVVYPDRAEVTRAQSLACGPRAIAVFAHLPPALDAGSLRARTSVGTVAALRVDPVARGDAYSPAAQALAGELRRCKAELASARDDLARASAVDTLARGYTDVAVALVGREMSAPAPDLRAWSTAFDLALATRLRDQAAAVQATARIRQLERQAGEVEERLATLAQYRSEARAEVLVACPGGQTAELELSYRVGSAAWAPVYEARADEAGATVELVTFAVVQQATGEDWKDADLLLSTAPPQRDATAPSLLPLRVGASEQGPERRVLVRHEELQPHRDTLASDGGGELPAAMATQPLPQGMSVRLRVAAPVDVAGDGKPVRLLVGRQRLRARFGLRAVPKMMPFVFRVAELSNTTPYPLLPGPVDTFRRSALIARQPLERVAEGAPFVLTFGVEESLRARRVVVAEVQREAGLLGQKRRFRYAYRFEVANYLPRAETLELADHVPVSELDDVKVIVDSKTTPGYEARPDDGIIKWRVPLRPGEERQLELVFHVDVPSSYESGDL
jgi:uncharacterized protein (TIGR02231 family)